MKSSFLFAVKVGAIAGALILAVFIPPLFIWPDPQNAIALFFAPVFAFFIGGCVAMIALGYKMLDATWAREWEGPLLMLMGGTILFLIFVFGITVLFKGASPI